MKEQLTTDQTPVESGQPSEPLASPRGFGDASITRSRWRELGAALEAVYRAQRRVLPGGWSVERSIVPDGWSAVAANGARWTVVTGRDHCGRPPQEEDRIECVRNEHGELPPFLSQLERALDVVQKAESLPVPAAPSDGLAALAQVALRALDSGAQERDRYGVTGLEADCCVSALSGCVRLELALASDSVETLRRVFGTAAPLPSLDGNQVQRLQWAVQRAERRAEEAERRAIPPELFERIVRALTVCARMLDEGAPHVWITVEDVAIGCRDLLSDLRAAGVEVRK